MFLKLATNGRSDKGFLLTSNVCPQGDFYPCPEAYTCIKSLKMCIKSDFEEMILKLATYGQREKAFLLSSKFCPQWIVCPSVPTGSGKHGKWLKIIPCMVKIMEFENIEKSWKNHRILPWDCFLDVNISQIFSRSLRLLYIFKSIRFSFLNRAIQNHLFFIIKQEYS